jgi:hypothetical protein
MGSVWPEMFAKSVSPIESVDSPSWLPRPSKSSEIEEGAGHGRDRSKALIRYARLTREKIVVLLPEPVTPATNASRLRLRSPISYDCPLLRRPCPTSPRGKYLST